MEDPPFLGHRKNMTSEC